MGSNAQKAATLGMPHGTANNRLRKSIMFKYVKMAGENYCYRCGAEICSVDDISIEHKEPWEGVSADLFFDLDNISFSHNRCNVPHNRYVPPRKDSHGRLGMYQRGCRCGECRSVKSIDNAKRVR